MKQNLTPMHRIGATFSVVVAIILLGYFAEHTLSCLLLSFVIAYLLDPFVVFLEGRKIGRTHGILILLCTSRRLLLLLHNHFFPPRDYPAGIRWSLISLCTTVKLRSWLGS